MQLVKPSTPSPNRAKKPANRKPSRSGTPVNLIFVYPGGGMKWLEPWDNTLPAVSICRINSKRGLRFEYEVLEGEGARFVLNRAQVDLLRDFLTYQLPRLEVFPADGGNA